MDSSIIDMLSKLADLMLACGAILVGFYHFVLAVWRRVHRPPLQAPIGGRVYLRSDFSRTDRRAPTPFGPPDAD